MIERPVRAGFAVKYRYKITFNFDDLVKNIKMAKESSLEKSNDIIHRISYLRHLRFML